VARQSQLQHLQTNDSAEGRGEQDVYVTFVIKSIALQQQRSDRAAAAARQSCGDNNALMQKAAAAAVAWPRRQLKGPAAAS